MGIVCNLQHMEASDQLEQLLQKPFGEQKP